MVKFTVDKDEIGILELNNPQSPVNIINAEFIEALANCLKLGHTQDLKGLIITSGKKDFMAGGDLKFILEMNSTAAVKKHCERIHEVFTSIESQGKPVVAAINGTALGGGLELTLCTHYRVCLNDSKVQLGFPEVTLGLLPGAGGTQRTPRLIGIQPSLELLTLGNKIDPEKALKLGLVHELAHTKEELLQKAVAWIKKNPTGAQPWHDKKYKIPGGAVQSPQAYQVFAASSAMIAEKTQNNYPAPRCILSCVYEGLQVPFETGLKIESRYFAKLAVDKVSKSMIQTLFFGIQECNKGAERPTQVQAMPTKTLGVLGAGMMGSGIAYVSAKAGMDVILKDVSAEAAEKGKSYSEKLCDALIQKGRMTVDQKQGLLGKIKATSEAQAVKDCDLVIETVIEDRKIKALVTQESENVMDVRAVMASNTSTLPITGLSQASKRPDHFIGIHFFSPVDKMPLVEIIMGEKTRDEALAKAIDYTQQIKKTPIVVNDGRGFYTSRVFTTYIAEGIHLLKDGVQPARIENAGKMAGMPVGPLAVADEVSLDLIYHIMKQTVEDIGAEKVDKACLEVSKLFVEQLKRLGRKSQGGFYEYPAGGKKTLWSGLSEYFPVTKKATPVQDIIDRLLIIQSLESYRCLEGKVLRSKRDGDVGSILGWGFPAYTGGSISYAKFIGVEKFIAKCEALAKKHGPRFAPNKAFILKA